MVRKITYRLLIGFTLLFLASVLSCTEDGRLNESEPVKKFMTEVRGYEPESFYLLGPEDGAVDLSLAPEFSWEASKNAVFYTLEIDDEDEFEEPMIYQTEIGFYVGDAIISYELPVGKLKGGVTYYWRVIAQNNVNEIEATNGPFMFTTRSPWSTGLSGGPTTKTSIVDLLEHPDGGFIVLASVEIGQLLMYPLLMRLNPDGSLDWAKKFGTPGKRLYPASIELKPDGGYVMLANEESALRTFNAWIFDLDELGATLSAHCYGDNKNDYELKSIALAPDGGVIVGGTIQEEVGYDEDPWLIKLDDRFEEEWQKRYVDGEHNYVLSSIFAAEHGIVMAGVQDKSIIDRYTGKRSDADSLLGRWSPERPMANRVWIAKASYNGDIKKANSLDHGKAYTFPVSIGETSHNGYAILANQLFKRLPYVGMMMFERDLTPRWEHWYVGGTETLVEHGSIARAPNGEFLGAVGGVRRDKPDGWFFKFASDGGHIWREALAGDYDAPVITNHVGAMNDGSVIVGGTYTVPLMHQKYDVNGIVMLLDYDGAGLLDDESPLMLEPLTMNQISSEVAPVTTISLEAIESEVPQLQWEYGVDDVTTDIIVIPLSGNELY